MYPVWSYNCKIWLLYLWQAEDDLDNILKGKVFMEPWLIIFKNHEGKYSQGFIIAEPAVLFEVTEFTIVDGLISLMEETCLAGYIESYLWLDVWTPSYICTNI